MSYDLQFDLWQLEIFVKSVDLKSFSKAAEASYISQPTVSNHISQLEKVFKTKLFDRIGRQIVPTKAGNLLYKHAKEMLDLKQLTIDTLQNYLGVMQGELVFGASTTPGTFVLPALMGKFKKEYPEVSLQISIGDSQQILDKIIEGELELGMIGFCPNEPFISCQEFTQDELVLVIPKGHPWEKKKSVTILELLKEPLLIREIGSGTRQLIEEKIFDKFKFKLNLDFNISVLGSNEAIKQAVLGDLGVSILSKLAVDLEIKHGYLIPIQLEDISFQRKFYSIHHTPRSLSPLCKTMLKFLEQQRKKPDD